MSRTTLTVGLLALGLVLSAGYLLWGTRTTPPPVVADTQPPPAPPPPAPMPAPIPPRRVAAPAPAPPAQVAAAPPLGTRDGMAPPDPDAERVEPAKPALSGETIRGAIKVAMPAVQECYHQVLAHEPDLNGRLVVHMTLRAEDGHGRVVSAEVQKGVEGEVDSPALTSCVLSALHSVDFPASGTGEMPITYPFFLVQ